MLGPVLNAIGNPRSLSFKELRSIYLARSVMKLNISSVLSEYRDKTKSLVKDRSKVRNRSISVRARQEAKSG